MKCTCQNLTSILALPFQACNDFRNNGTCVAQCPPAIIYNPDLFRIMPNPNYRLAAGHLCVEQCPGEQVCLHCVFDLFVCALRMGQNVGGALESLKIEF